MYDGQMIFSQLIDFIPRYEFRKCVSRYQGNSRVRTFSCWNHYANFWIMPILGLKPTPEAVIAEMGLA